MKKASLPNRAKATVDQLKEAYSALGNVHRVAELFGMCGQSVHERLAKHGVSFRNPPFSQSERDRLAEEYESFASRGRLDELSALMGRTRPFICRQARAMGLTNTMRRRPWAKGNAWAFRAWQEINGHPNIGLKFFYSAERRNEITIKRHKTMMTKYGKVVMTRGENRSWKAGWREIAGRRIFFRSKWEANYALYLEWLRTNAKIASWEHEPETFWFEKIKRGVRSFLIDFRVVEVDGSITYHEVKGWMDDRSATKIKRMRIYHPHINLVVIKAKEYNAIRLYFARMLRGWEY